MRVQQKDAAKQYVAPTFEVIPFRTSKSLFVSDNVGGWDSGGVNW